MSDFKCKRQKINEDFEYAYTNDRNSLFVDIKKSITNNVVGYLKSLQNTDSISQIDIKLCIDGNQLGKSASLMNFCYTILNNKETAKSAFGNITIGISNISESYEDLVEPITHIMRQIEQLPFVLFNNRVVKLKYFFVADLKLLAICLGIYSATSNYPCPWCHCHASNLYKTNFSVKNGRQSVKDNSVYFKKKDHLGYKHPNLLTAIPYLQVVPDITRLRLKIFNVLIREFVKELVVIDNYNYKEITKENKNLNTWINFLKFQCKISVRSGGYNVDNCGVVTRDFNGSEILKIFDLIDIQNMFPNLVLKEKKQELWKELYELDRNLSYNSIDHTQFKSRAESWMNKFLECYNSKIVTPYMHILVNHIHEFLEEYKDISVFTLQGLESLNNISTQEYFRGTNRNKDYLKQIFNRRLRIENYELKRQ